MSTDEELDHLEDRIRQLKIEFDVFFNGGARRLPFDTQRRVEVLIKKYSDAGGLSFAQRFRYNGLAQKYALFAGQWRRKVRLQEEGLDYPNANVGRSEERCWEFRTNVDASSNGMQELLNAFLDAKQRCGEATDKVNLGTFRRFVQEKTEQIRREFRCEEVGYTVSIEQGRVKLMARAM